MGAAGAVAATPSGIGATGGRGPAQLANINVSAQLGAATIQRREWLENIFMLIILLEAAAALAVIVLIVWWTMFSGRKNGERKD